MTLTSAVAHFNPRNKFRVRFDLGIIKPPFPSKLGPAPRSASLNASNQQAGIDPGNISFMISPLR